MWVLPPVEMGVSLGLNPPYAVFRNTPKDDGYYGIKFKLLNKKKIK